MFNFSCEECGADMNKIYHLMSKRQGVGVFLEVCKECYNENRISLMGSRYEGKNKKRM